MTGSLTKITLIRIVAVAPNQGLSLINDWKFANLKHVLGLNLFSKV